MSRSRLLLAKAFSSSAANVKDEFVQIFHLNRKIEEEFVHIFYLASFYVFCQNFIWFLVE